MYKMKGFEEKRIDALFGLMRANPLGTLCVNDDDGLAAYHVPFEIVAPTEAAPQGVLRGHVARANALWALAGRPVLVVFNGPSAYVTPDLYEGKALHHKEVPTYDYAVTHAHGVLRAIDDPAWMLDFLGRLTQQHEAARALPWKIEDAPREFIDQLLTHLVGIEIVIERLAGMTKMSQNRSARDRAAIAAAIPSIAAQVTSAVRQ
jgi:transcriptional regulator